MPYADPQVRAEKKAEWQRRDRERNPGKAAREQRAWRRRNPEQAARLSRAQRDRHPERARARDAVNNAIREGRLTRLPCEVCGETAEAHHDDYSKPLEVRWLCKKHHGEEHN